jgi:hypothetical protein
LEQLTNFTEKAKSSDYFLTAVWKDAGKMFKDCHMGLRDIRAREWDRILFWLKSSRWGTVAKGPMNIYLKEKMVEEYGSYWQRFLCFCFRTMDLEVSLSFEMSAEGLRGGLHR